MKKTEEELMAYKKALASMSENQKELFLNKEKIRSRHEYWAFDSHFRQLISSFQNELMQQTHCMESSFVTYQDLATLTIVREFWFYREKDSPIRLCSLKNWANGPSNIVWSWDPFWRGDAEAKKSAINNLISKFEKPANKPREKQKEITRKDLHKWVDSARAKEIAKRLKTGIQVLCESTDLLNEFFAECDSFGDYYKRPWSIPELEDENAIYLGRTADGVVYALDDLWYEDTYQVFFKGNHPSDVGKATAFGFKELNPNYVVVIKQPLLPFTTPLRNISPFITDYGNEGKRKIIYFAHKLKCVHSF
jgi:hypothetical protein